MRIRKTAAVMLALIVVMSLAMPVFAATGYGSGTTGGSPANGGRVDGYTPSTGSSGSSGPAAASNPAPASTAQVTAATNEAIKQAAASGGQATITLVNVSTIPASTIKSAFAQANKASAVDNTVLRVDAREGGVVLSRVYIDEATAAKLTGTVDLSVTTKGASVDRTVNTFEKYFDNNISAVSLGQKGAFGTDIKMAVKVDLSKLNTSNLVFYAYNKETGKYAKLTPTYRVDSNGYLHFTTPVGGDIIISDKPLARK